MRIEDAEKQGILKSHLLITNSHQVTEILGNIGKCQECWNGLYVKAKEGEYESVYAFKGPVPYRRKKLTKLL